MYTTGYWLIDVFLFLLLLFVLYKLALAIIAKL